MGGYEIEGNPLSISILSWIFRVRDMKNRVRTIFFGDTNGELIKNVRPNMRILMRNGNVTRCFFA